MKLRRFGVLLPALAVLAACASTPPMPDWPEGADDSAARFKKDLTTLASDAYEGREAGTAGYDKAVDYVVGSFEEIGLTPAGENGYLQQVPLRRATIVPNASKLTLMGGNDDLDLTLNEDFFMMAAPSVADVNVSGELVYVGHGLIADALDINDYDGLDVRGKIVVVKQGLPDGLPSEERAHFGSSATKYRIAAEQGAIGVIGISSDRASTDGGRAQMVRYAGLPDNLVGYPEGMSQTVEAKALLSKDGSEKLLAASGLEWDDVFDGDAVKGPMGLSAKMIAKTEFEDYTAPNVVGMIKGADPALRDEYVVLTAHLDHIGMLKSVEEGKDIINNGAMDNASGISTLLEEARKFTGDRDRPRRSILFVALAAEEKGLLGSEYFANHPTVPQSAMVANVNLDMPILLHEFTDVIAFGAEHSSMKGIVEEAATSMGVTLTPDPVPHMVLFVRSDHYNFVKVGVPSVFLFLGWADGGEEAFQMFMAEHYHRPSDQPDLPILYDMGAKFAELNYRIAKTIANADDRPVWNEGDFFGDTFGRKPGM